MMAVGDFNLVSGFSSFTAQWPVASRLTVAPTYNSSASSSSSWNPQLLILSCSSLLIQFTNTDGEHTDCFPFYQGYMALRVCLGRVTFIFV